MRQARAGAAATAAALEAAAELAGGEAAQLRQALEQITAERDALGAAFERQQQVGSLIDWLVVTAVRPDKYTHTHTYKGHASVVKQQFGGHEFRRARPGDRLNVG